jgi:predicted choloylglycine hydrolase
MKRRTFLQLSLVAPAFLKFGCTPKEEGFVKFTKGTDKSFDMLEVSGSYHDIGLSIGKQFSPAINNIMNERKDWLNSLLAIQNSEKGKKYSDELLRTTRDRLPHLIQELEGMADGSKIDFKTLWAMSIQSELGNFEMETPACSTVYYHDNQNTWHFHNEDGDVAYKDRMFVLKATPPSGVSFITLVYTGVIAGVGPSINSEGIIETTNFLPAVKSEIGIPRYFLGRAILEARNLAEAINIATSSPRAFPWHHNLLSVKTDEYASVETLPDGITDVNRPNGTYIHTNHQIGKNTSDYGGDSLKARVEESYTRYNVLQDEKNDVDGSITDPTTILDWLSTHKDAPNAPCKHAKDSDTGQTLAAAFFDVKKGTMRLYKGNPCYAVPNGLYTEYKF